MSAGSSLGVMTLPYKQARNEALTDFERVYLQHLRERAAGTYLMMREMKA